jgi:transposase
MTDRKPYATDLSDDRWALVAPLLEHWRAQRAAATPPGCAEPSHDLREIVNAILYVNRAGCAWHLLPHDFPPYQTVYYYFAAWERDGTAGQVHDLLRRKVRVSAGRTPEPSTAIYDAQSVKTSGNVPEAGQGIDAGKKIKGRKRHIATDTLGLILVVLVTAASVQDNAGGIALTQHVAARYPSVARAWVDQGYKKAVAEDAARHGIDVRVYAKDPAVKGFAATPRWPVERTYGWLMLHRRLGRDFETLPDRSAAQIHWAMIDNMSRRLTKETTLAWRTPASTTDVPAAA